MPWGNLGHFILEVTIGAQQQSGGLLSAMVLQTGYHYMRRLRRAVALLTFIFNSMKKTNYEAGDVIRIMLDDFQDTFAEVVRTPKGPALKGLFSEGEETLIPIGYIRIVREYITDQETAVLKAILEVEGKQVHIARWAEVCRRCRAGQESGEQIQSNN